MAIDAEHQTMHAERKFVWKDLNHSCKTHFGLEKYNGKYGQGQMEKTKAEEKQPQTK